MDRLKRAKANIGGMVARNVGSAREGTHETLTAERKQSVCGTLSTSCQVPAHLSAAYLLLSCYLLRSKISKFVQALMGCGLKPIQKAASTRCARLMVVERFTRAPPM